MIEGKELVDKSELSKVKSVHEMMPRNMSANLRGKGNAARITDEHLNTIEDCLRLDFTIREACDAAGISVASYYHYYNKDSDFALRMDRAKNFPKQMARTAVMKRIWQGDAKTALRYLELRDKRYKSEEVVEEGEESTAPVVQFISVASNEGVSNTTNPDTQNDIEQKSASDSSVSFGESGTESQTGWENEEEVLRRLA